MHRCVNEDCLKEIQPSDIHCPYCGVRQENRIKSLVVILLSSLVFVGIVVLLVNGWGNELGLDSMPTQTIDITPSFTISSTKTIQRTSLKMPGTQTPTKTFTVTSTSTLQQQEYGTIQFNDLDRLSKYELPFEYNYRFDSIFINGNNIYSTNGSCNSKKISSIPVMEVSLLQSIVINLGNQISEDGLCVDTDNSQNEIVYYDLVKGISGESTGYQINGKSPFAESYTWSGSTFALEFYSKPNDIPLSDIQTIYIYNSGERKEVDKIVHRNTYEDGNLRVRDTIIGMRILEDQKHFNYWTQIFNVNPDGSNYYLYSVHYKNLETGESKYKNFKNKVVNVDYSTYSDELVISTSKEIDLWNFSTDELNRGIYSSVENEEISSSELSNKGDLLVIGISNGNIHFFDLINDVETSLSSGHNLIVDIAFSKEDQIMATWHEDGSVLLWFIQK